MQLQGYVAIVFFSLRLFYEKVLTTKRQEINRYKSSFAEIGCRKNLMFEGVNYGGPQVSRQNNLVNMTTTIILPQLHFKSTTTIENIWQQLL